MKVIFLDIDGVLNSEEWYTKRPSDGHWPVSHLDPDAIKVLNEIIDRTGAVVVVTSTWRIGQMRTWLQEKLTEAGFTGTVLGKTTVLDTERGHEIQEWFDNVAPMYERRHSDVSNYVILDDDTDMAHLRNKLVHIDRRKGLTRAYIDEILGHLGELK